MPVIVVPHGEMIVKATCSLRQSNKVDCPEHEKK